MSDEERELPPHLRSRLGGPLGHRARRALGKAMDQTKDRIDSGRVGRAAKLSRLALSAGKHAIGQRFRGEEGRSTSGVGLAAEMLETFSELRGVTMKLGQMLSYLDDALPPEARRVLTVLQRDVAPMPWEKMAEVFEASLGKKPEEVFETIETTALAAASIGQVHRATLPGGREVVVKIQYPGIAEAMKSDLQNARIFGLMQKTLAFSTDAAAITKELEDRFMDECDYRKEAAYQRAYRARFEGHPIVVVPEVHDELVSEKVIVSDYAEGMGFYEWLDTQPSEAELARAADTFFRFYLGSFYLDGLFNCDPHPGNYLFRDDGKIVFLDYGCCRRFTEERIGDWVNLLQCVTRDDILEMEEAAYRVGFFARGKVFDRTAYRELMRYLYEAYLVDEPFTFREHRPKETFSKMFQHNANLFKMNMPADAVFLNRITFGLVSLMGEMDARLSVRRKFESYVQGIDEDWPEDPRRGQRFTV